MNPSKLDSVNNRRPPVDATKPPIALEFGDIEYDDDEEEQFEDDESNDLLKICIRVLMVTKRSSMDDRFTEFVKLRENLPREPIRIGSSRSRRSQMNEARSS